MFFTLTWSQTKKHSIDWEKVHSWERKIKEALFINAQNPGKEKGKGNLLNLEKGINLDPIWGAFNPELREIATKKILGRTWFLRCLMVFPFFSKYLSVHVHACVCVCMFEFRLGWSVMEPDWKLCQLGPWWRHQCVSKRRRNLFLTELNIVYHHSNQYTFTLVYTSLVFARK